MVAAVPFAVSAAVNKQMRAARDSWSVSDRKLCQTSSGRSKLFDSTDSNLSVVTIRSRVPETVPLKLPFRLASWALEAKRMTTKPG
jgi:hypothetical protein